MAMEQIQKYCQSCEKNVLATRKGVNHILHLLLSVFTIGAWVIVWFLLVLSKNGEWRCTQCGGENFKFEAGKIKLNMAQGLVLLLIIMAAIGHFAIKG